MAPTVEGSQRGKREEEEEDALFKTSFGGLGVEGGTRVDYRGLAIEGAGRERRQRTGGQSRVKASAQECTNPQRIIEEKTSLLRRQCRRWKKCAKVTARREERKERARKEGPRECLLPTSFSLVWTSRSSRPLDLMLSKGYLAAIHSNS